MTTAEDLIRMAGPEYGAPPLDPDRIHIINLVAFMDDGRAFRAHIDQRDHRRAMVAICSQDPNTDKLGFLRACAWSYLQRTGQTGEGWAAFDAACIEVLDDDPPATPVDPTGTATAG